MARTLECEQSKSQFEHDSRWLQDSYNGAIGSVENWRKTLYRALIESNYNEDEENKEPSPTVDPSRVGKPSANDASANIRREGIISESN